MAKLPILEYPDPRLRIRAEPVTKVDSEIRRFVDDLLETMYAASGVGLAATQVDRHIRILTVDVSEARNEPYCLINPEIVEASGRAVGDEGCLSVPEYYDAVERADADARSTGTATRRSSRPRDCSRSACSTRSTISTASSSSTTCRK